MKLAVYINNKCSFNFTKSFLYCMQEYRDKVSALILNVYIASGNHVYVASMIVVCVCVLNLDAYNIK